MGQRRQGRRSSGSGQELWIYAELDQFAATLSIADPALAPRYLTRSYDYWRRYFVDPRHVEVWTSVRGDTNLPIGDLPSQWPWKNGYHSLEHALVSYIAAAGPRGAAGHALFRTRLKRARGHISSRPNRNPAPCGKTGSWGEPLAGPHAFGAGEFVEAGA